MVRLSGDDLLAHVAPLGWEHINLTAITFGGSTGEWKAGDFDPFDPFSFPNVRFFRFVS